MTNNFWQDYRWIGLRNSNFPLNGTKNSVGQVNRFPFAINEICYSTSSSYLLLSVSIGYCYDCSNTWKWNEQQKLSVAAKKRNCISSAKQNWHAINDGRYIRLAPYALLYIPQWNIHYQCDWLPNYVVKLLIDPWYLNHRKTIAWDTFKKYIFFLLNVTRGWAWVAEQIDVLMHVIYLRQWRPKSMIAPCVQYHHLHW